MSTTSGSSIEVWIDNVQTPQNLYEPSIPPNLPWASDDKENPRTAAKKRRIMQSDHDQTPRPLKRLRDLDDASRFLPSSPTTSASSEAVSDAFEAESHRSGRLSPVKQIQLLEDFEDQPVIFCNFDDDMDGAEPDNVTSMRRAIQRFADGIGILGYENMDEAVSALPPLERIRFRYPWASDLNQRCSIGSMPSTAQVLDIVKTARQHDRGSGVSEDEWNSEVQHPLLKLACSTCKHSETLIVLNVKTARIEPASLSRSTLPGRVVDYVVALKPDSILDQAWRRLRPLPSMSIKSWNHTTRARRNPIAIHVETKSPMKSWTDGKPQIAIWTDALLKRLALISSNASGSWPAVPLLIAQGHDWHLLIVSKNGQKMIIWEQIDIGSTRSCFDTMKVLAALHWLMDWAERVWRPWFLSLVVQ